MSKDFPVKGLAELDRYLSALPMKLQRGAYRAALVAAAAPVRDRAKSLARKASGKMAKSIKTGSPIQNPDGTFSVFVRLKGDHAFLGHFHEYGVSPHPITVKTTKSVVKAGTVKRALKIGDRFVSGTISHPGHRASPFMRPALDLESDNAVRAFADRIRTYIEGKTGFVAPMDEAA